MALVANELLAFIQHAIDTINEISILQICKSSFTSEEIAQGKQLLYETLGQSANMPSRRRDGTEKSVQDIISLLKQTDPDEVPAFVAKKLHKLPPVTLDHVDVVTLLKDIRFLKEELAEFRGRLQASESTISDLRNELSQLKRGNSICRPPDAAFVTRHRGAQAITFSPSALSDGSTHEHVIAATAAAPAACSPPATEPRPNYASVAACPPPSPPRPKNKGKKEAPAEECPLSKKDRKCDDDGFIRVERKKKKPVVRNHRGTAPEGPEQLLRRETPATPLYVSRLHWSTTVEQVVDYIRSKTHFVLRVERLESRHKVNFSSFVVRVPTHHLPTFEKEEFWPIGVVYRRFRGRLPNTSRRTSQTIRV